MKGTRVIPAVIVGLTVQLTLLTWLAITVAYRP